MADSGFSTSKERHIAALLRSKGALNAAELLRIVGGDKKTLKRCLDRLRARGLLDYVASETGAIARGHPAGLWSLTEAGARVGAASQGEPSNDDGVMPVTSINDGQVWITAVVTANTTADLRAVLADGELSAAASSVVRVDGEGQGYVFVFDASVGNQPPDNLQAALEAIGVPCSVGVVRDTQTSDEFVSSVRTARTAAERALDCRAEQ
jgi:DNA-binding MarR family transcriptional regulator